MIYTLVADGMSDAVLLPLLDWSLRQHRVTPVVAQSADLSRLPRHVQGLEARLRAALDLYPCDLLFVHRDAEGQPAEMRRAEISHALAWAHVRYVPVVPVRMTEAWLLADEQAIRRAAGNPNGRDVIHLPELRRIESIPDPKAVLFQALKAASGLNTHRRSRLPIPRRVQLITRYTDDFSHLSALAAFRSLQGDIRTAIERIRE